MNGIDAVAVATGNDWRAVEAGKRDRKIISVTETLMGHSGAHSFATYNRKYTSLTTYSKDADGHLVGEIELPLALGKVG